MIDEKQVKIAREWYESTDSTTQAMVTTLICEARLSVADWIIDQLKSWCKHHTLTRSLPQFLSYLLDHIQTRTFRGGDTE